MNIVRCKGQVSIDFPCTKRLFDYNTENAIIEVVCRYCHYKNVIVISGGVISQTSYPKA